MIVKTIKTKAERCIRRQPDGSGNCRGRLLFHTMMRTAGKKYSDGKWRSIDWTRVRKIVTKYQKSIAEAAVARDWNGVVRNQKKLVESTSARLLAVRHVTTAGGRNTPGIDGVVLTDPAEKLKIAMKLTGEGYKAQPLKRINIPKPGKIEKRPLSIPTSRDRAVQTLYAYALDPVAEAIYTDKSFGFRLYKNCQDAIAYITEILSAADAPKWVLEGDIKGCFDNISHEWLLENIPMDRAVLQQFLKAGYIEKGKWQPTLRGTPQGGVISPVLCNMALDGMGALLSQKFQKSDKVNLVRYADDFIVTAANQSVALQAKRHLRNFLAIRGLELSDEKTLITRVNNGFDFLGHTISKYEGIIHVKPSEKAISGFILGLEAMVFGEGTLLSEPELIERINQQLRGWGNYFCYCDARDAFMWVDAALAEIMAERDDTAMEVIRNGAIQRTANYKTNIHAAQKA